MKHYCIDHLTTYLFIIEEDQRRNDMSDAPLEAYLFRGQSADYPLIPKLCRHIKQEILEREAQILAEFKRANPLLLYPYQLLDDWDCLTLGQHYGLPTRFLDWSTNALTALWFAVKQRGDTADDAIVWILRTKREHYVEELTGKSPFELERSMFFRPRILKQRINNQSGVFSVLCDEDLLNGVRLDEMPQFNANLIKVSIPNKAHKQLLAQLHTLGIHAFSIFPELDGLCAYLEWKYTSGFEKDHTSPF